MAAFLSGLRCKRGKGESLHAGALARCDMWKWRGVYVQVRDSDVADKCRLDNIADQKTFCNLAEMVLVFGLPHILSIVPPAIFELMKAVPLPTFLARLSPYPSVAGAVRPRFFVLGT